ncbi:chromosome segregation protein SMC [halophilic archaeon]|nr:chromosome segregation protein SMC [halophilic archaeon]
MTPTTTMETEASLTVENIGGISETDVDLTSGVNVLAGRNATNRTSFLRSIMAVLGSENVAIKGDAEKGHVELTIDGETYTRTLERNSQTVEKGGNPYLDDPTVANLFAFLLEDNEARRAVVQGDDLRSVIMRPVDTSEIERKVQEVKQEKSRLDNRLTELRTKKDRLPSLEQERTELQTELEAKREKLTEAKEEIDSLDPSLSESREQRDELEEHLANLNEARKELETTRRRLESEQEQYEALKSERSELREERNELPTSVQEISDVGQRIGKLQERKRNLDSLLDRLQNIIQFNRDIIEESNSELREALIPEDGHVTEQLLEEKQELVCWTCGSHVERDEVEETLENLHDLREEKMNERKEVSSELDDLRERKQDMEKRQQRREQLVHQLERIDDKINRREDQIAEFREKRDELTNRISELEGEVEDLERDEEDEQVLDLNKRANELEVSISDLESKLEEVDDEINRIEAEIDKIEELESEREDAQERLTELRGYVDALEESAIEAFNKHISNLLDRLEYRNIDRIWIERRETTTKKGRQAVTENKFDLHIVRTTEDGAAYEDTVSHLSESEREVTGLVFALAGYLVHDVHEDVPFMLLDSLEAIDSERIATLVTYFEEYADFLVVALLQEDAQALDDDYRRIEDI